MTYEILHQRQPTFSKTLKILITGQVGIGKTSVLNGIFLSETDNSRVVRTDETDIKYNLNLNGVDVTVYDIPGLNNPEVKDEDILQEMARVTQEQVDLIILCFNMRGRVTKADVEIIKKLTTSFDRAGPGVTIWKNTMCILTFANEVAQPPSSTEDSASNFHKSLKEFDKVIRDHICRETGIGPIAAQEIPIIPAGSMHQPVIPSINYNWIEKAKAAALERVSSAGHPALLKVSPSLHNNKPPPTPPTPSLISSLKQCVCKKIW